MIKIDLSPLVHAKNGARQVVDLNLDAITIEQLELNYLQGRLRFTRTDTGILVEGILDTEIATECTRCLTSFYEPVTFEPDNVISFPGAPLTLERPVRVTDNGWADISPVIREYIWMAFPSNPICSPRCQGICAKCGGNINLGECTCEGTEPIDPRWEVLRTLLDEPGEST